MGRSQGWDTIVRNLKSQARTAAKSRGHDLPPFKKSDGPNGHPRFISECLCGMQAVVTPMPEPNGVEIGGKAVALNCTEPRRIKSPDGLGSMRRTGLNQR